MAVTAFYGVNPTLSLGVHAAGARHIPARRLRALDDPVEASTLGQIFVGAAANIDVLVVIPYISLMAGVTADGGAFDRDQRFLPAIKGALGLDYRPQRRWAIGAQIDWHGVFPNFLDYPAQSTILVRFTYVLDFRGL